MKYSFVIPCYNEEHNIGRCLTSVHQAIEAWQSQVTDTSREAEVMVVDNGSTDQGVAIAKEIADTVLEFNRVHISRLRNAGGEAAQGEIIIFLDGDIVVPGDWLSHVDEFFCEPNVDAIGYVDLAPDDAPWFARFWGQRVTAKRGVKKEIDTLPGRNIAIKKSVFTRISGFDDGLQTGEDKDFIMRARKSGAVVYTSPSPTLLHLGYEKTFREWMRKEYWRQHSHVDLILKQGFSLRLARFPVIALAHLVFALFIVLSLLQGDFSSVIKLIAISAIPSFAMSLLSEYSRKSVSTYLGFSLLYWIRFVVAGWSILRALFESRQKLVAGVKTSSSNVV